MLALLCCLNGPVRGQDPHTVKIRLSDDKSQWAEWTPPAKASDFKDQKPVESLLGLLFAGRGEFNWVVDVRSDSIDQEGWAVGNLVDSMHALTTCRVMWYLEKTSQFRGQDQDRITTYYAGSDIRVNFCTNYLWEDYRPFTEDGKKMTYEYTSPTSTSGGRVAKKLIFHPKCSLNSLKFDVGVIELSQPIKEKFSEYSTPYIGFIPVEVDVTTGLVKTHDLSPGSVCYIASFGKNFMNAQNHVVIDYKIKFPVKMQSFESCWNVWDDLCVKNMVACDKNLYPERRLDEFWCLSGMAKRGAVCNHDRGAPLVCNGNVVGMVTRGYSLETCDNKNVDTHFLAHRLDKAGDIQHSFYKDCKERSLAIKLSAHRILIVISTILWHWSHALGHVPVK